MQYKIEKLGTPISYIEKNKKVMMYGYSFIGEHGLCLCIAWGENRKNYWVETLKNFEHIKYK